MRGCTVVLAQQCATKGCPSEELHEVGNGGGGVFFECEQGHFTVIGAGELDEMLRSE